LSGGGRPASLTDYDAAGAVILPVPYERTTSFGRGTAGGPEALLRASYQVETWDDELGFEPCDQGVATLPPCDPASEDLAQAIAEIESEAGRHLEAGKFLVTLGGEHTVTLGPARAARRGCADGGGGIGIVQFDAHADLRDTYEGTPYSHACVMRRLVEDGWPAVAVGIRSLSAPEEQLIAAGKVATIRGAELEGGAEDRFAELVEQLPERIYLTFDVDYFDPSLLPATGTPEPGGGSWYPTLRMLRRLFESKRVVAADVVELAPIAGQPASDFTAAKLVMKLLGYHRSAAERRGGASH
jgi:agmatinase